MSVKNAKSATDCVVLLRGFGGLFFAHHRMKYLPPILQQLPQPKHLRHGQRAVRAEGGQLRPDHRRVPTLRQRIERHGKPRRLLRGLQGQSVHLPLLAPADAVVVAVAPPCLLNAPLWTGRTAQQEEVTLHD